MKHTVRNDLLLVSALLLLAAFFWRVNGNTRVDGSYVLVRFAGEEIGRYPLDEDAIFSLTAGSASVVPTPADAPLSGQFGDYNLLVIEKGSVYIREASCSGQDCVRQGKIRYQGQTIICLPHQLVVEIVGGKSTGLDAMTG